MPYVVIDYCKVEMSNDEIEYFNNIIKDHGKECFSGLLKTNKNGIISIIKPTKTIPWSVLFFVQNLMINQNLRAFDFRIAEMEKKLDLK